MKKPESRFLILFPQHLQQHFLHQQQQQQQTDGHFRQLLVLGKSIAEASHA